MILILVYLVMAVTKVSPSTPLWYASLLFFYPQQKTVFILIHSVLLSTWRMFTGTDSFWSNAEYFYTFFQPEQPQKHWAAGSEMIWKKILILKKFSSSFPLSLEFSHFTAEIYNETIKYTKLILMEIITFCEVLKA